MALCYDSASETEKTQETQREIAVHVLCGRLGKIFKLYALLKRNAVVRKTFKNQRDPYLLPPSLKIATSGSHDLLWPTTGIGSFGTPAQLHIFKIFKRQADASSLHAKAAIPGVASVSSTRFTPVLDSIPLVDKNLNLSSSFLNKFFCCASR